jgi:c-di-GMP-binding flagellar brake protein YcgR
MELLPHQDMLEVRVKGFGSEPPVMYLSRVEAISTHSIVIQWPSNRGFLAPVAENDLLTVSFARGTTAYRLDCRVTKCISAPLPSLVVSTEGPIQEIERRDHERASARLEVLLTARAVTTDPSSIAGHIRNISGGGFSIRYRIAPPVGAVYDVTLFLPDLDTRVKMAAQVVRVDRAANHALTLELYEVGFSFTAIAEPTRREIIRQVVRIRESAPAE